MARSKLGSKGRLVVPREVREFLGLREGDSIDFVIRDGGQIVIRPAVLDIRALRGLLARKTGAVLRVDEMNAAIRRRAAGR